MEDNLGKILIYRNEDEVSSSNRVVSMYLDYAEDQALQRKDDASITVNSYVRTWVNCWQKPNE